MGISTEMAMKMVEEKMAAEAAQAQPAEVKPETVQTTEPDPKPEEKPEDKPAEETKPDDKPEEKPEDKPEEKQKPEQTGPKDDKPVEGADKDKPAEESKPEKKLPPKQRYTKEERMQHAFARQKERLKKVEAERKELEAKNAELEKKLEKYHGLTLEDFDNKTEPYLNYKLEEQRLQNEMAQNKKEIERSEKEAVEAELDRRMHLSFDSEEEIEDYRYLLDRNGPDFFKALNENDPNGVVVDYLNSVEKFPLVLKELMTNMDSLRKVFVSKDPTMLRINLDKFTRDFLAGKTQPVTDKETAGQPAQQPQQPKKEMPVIGKQVTAAGKPSEPVHDRNYWNDYLRKHPHG